MQRPAGFAKQKLARLSYGQIRESIGDGRGILYYRRNRPVVAQIRDRRGPTAGKSAVAVTIEMHNEPAVFTAVQFYHAAAGGSLAFRGSVRAKQDQ
jgi:hypothetical protein